MKYTLFIFLLLPLFAESQVKDSIFKRNNFFLTDTIWRKVDTVKCIIQTYKIASDGIECEIGEVIIESKVGWVRRINQFPQEFFDLQLNPIKNVWSPIRTYREGLHIYLIPTPEYMLIEW